MPDEKQHLSGSPFEYRKMDGFRPLDMSDGRWQWKTEGLKVTVYCPRGREFSGWLFGTEKNPEVVTPQMIRDFIKLVRD